jgi:propanol-preferring alcohol dehydrogenase
MRAVVLPAANQPLVVVDDHPAAGTGRRGGEIIDVTACGVCHSDIHVVDGDFPSPLPIVLGHEVTGVHSELGPVMLYAPWGCGNCQQCTDGEEMICANATEAGLFTDGGYSEQMWVKDRRYLAPLDGLDPISSAPLACGGLTAYRAVRHGLDILHNVGERGRALVIGAGGLGQYAITYLRMMSDAQVIALDLAEDKRGQAIQIGAHEAVGADAEIAPCDVVIDFIGADVTLATAAATVARKGTVIVVGLAAGTTPFGLTVVAPEARFMSSFWGTRSEMDDLLALARREPSIVRPVETLPLADAQSAHDRLRSGQFTSRLVLLP